MELKQLRYFVRVVELGSISRAALDLGLVQSALSQQIQRLEAELGTALLRRQPHGVSPTEGGVAFFREAQLALRHAEQAARAASQARLGGSVSVGLSPTTAAVLGLPFMQAMRERHPGVRLHLVESLSGHLTEMLNARQLDLAVLFDGRSRAHEHLQAARRWSVAPLVEEDLFLLRLQGDAPAPRSLQLARLGAQALILPTRSHGLRRTLDEAFARAGIKPHVVLEIDSLSMLMDAVKAGLGATLQPWSALLRTAGQAEAFAMSRIADRGVRRVNWLCGLSEDELSPAALAARTVLRDCALESVRSARWLGARESSGH